MAIEELLDQLSPRRRRGLVRFLELATDNPYLDAHWRARAEEHLRRCKGYLAFLHLTGRRHYLHRPVRPESPPPRD